MISQFVANYQLGYSWVQFKNAAAKGFAFDADGRFREGIDLAKLFHSVASEDDFVGILKTIDGCFSVVVTLGGHWLVAVDRLRTQPLFLAADGQKFIISDDPFEASDRLGLSTVDPLGKCEFHFAGYVTGNETLMQGVWQIGAGQYLYTKGLRLPGSIQTYWQFQPTLESQSSEEQMIRELDSVLFRIFERMLHSLNGAHITVPLSGGQDSRLIAIMLSRLGVKNVTCFTYGNWNDWEVRVSEYVSRKLGFEWRFVPYSRKTWRKSLNSEKLQPMWRFGARFCSCLNLQDWPAVNELLRTGVIPNSTVFMPGHSGDFLAGSHIPVQIATKKTASVEDVVTAITSRHYTLDWSKKTPATIRQKILRLLNIESMNEEITVEDAIAKFERWDLSERQSKFICNSVRVYEAFNAKWRLPLWDIDLIKFWSKVPVESRLNRRFYFRFAEATQRKILPDVTYSEAERKRVSRVSHLAEKCLRHAAEYFTHPLRYYGIVSYPEYLRLKLSGVRGIDGIMARMYLERLEAGEGKVRVPRCFQWLE